MAEPFGVPAGRGSSEVPGAHPGGPRPLPPAPAPPDGDGEEPQVGEAPEGQSRPDGSGASEPASGADGSTPVAIGEDEEVLDLDEDDELAAVPTRSDDQG
jgi:hypothetical protein